MKHLTMRVLVRSLSLFMHCRCDSMEDLPEEPIIFCCNHYELFGPIAAVISLPVKLKLLINDDILKPMDNWASVIIEMQKAAEEMEKGNSILIFPECGMPTYSIGAVTEFRQGFAIIGEFYRKRTGKDALFCPTYIDKWAKQIHFGELIPFGRGPAKEECQKVSQKLYHSMMAMAEKYGHVPETYEDEEELEEKVCSVHG